MKTVKRSIPEHSKLRSFDIFLIHPHPTALLLQIAKNQYYSTKTFGKPFVEVGAGYLSQEFWNWAGSVKSMAVLGAVGVELDIAEKWSFVPSLSYTLLEGESDGQFLVSGTLYYRFFESIRIRKMHSLLNRSAVILTPKKKFLKWVNEVDKSGEFKLSDADIKRDPTIYLVDEAILTDEAEIRLIMDKNYLEIAIEEFASWWTDDRDWPVLKSLKDFEEYFLWKYYDMVVDVADEDLEIEEM